MRLSLSSAAAPDAALAELLAACARRGLAALELVEGDAHGIFAGIDPARIEAVRSSVRDSGVEICGLYCEMPRPGDLEAAARLGAALDVPLIVPVETIDWRILPEAAGVFAAAGSRLLLAHGSNPATVDVILRVLATMSDSGAIGLAWELRPERDDPALIGGVLTAAGSHLCYMRLHGGGPEAARQSGHGVGAVMGRLALARYAGPLVLTPSTSRYHYAWRAWLGRVGGWGCGSKQADPSLVTLALATTGAGEIP